MSKFRYYNASLFTGDVRGTDDEALALDIATSEDDFVIDSETGEWLHADGSRHPIEALRKEGASS